ncbi:MAG: SpoIIE family protein phosphatase, partial [Bdellovibrionales bacterium]
MSNTADDDNNTGDKTNVVRGDNLRAVDPNQKLPPCLVLLVGPPDYLGRQWLIDKPSVTIGRNVNAGIHVSENSLSKIHARVELNNNHVTIVDLGSTNKTQINSEQLTPHQAYQLKNNDQIRTGDLVFKFLERGILSETKEKARMQSELETARSVQASLLPQNPNARYQWVEIGGRYLPASELGGDWWWHWSTNRKAFAILGDATGHGAAAGLITSAARSAMATLEDDDSIGIEKVYTTLSRAIHKCAAGKLAMSAFIIEVDLFTKNLRYINASHLPAVSLPPETSGLSWNKLDFISDPRSPLLGAPEQDFAVGEGDINPPTRLLLLTDGLTERLDLQKNALNERAFYTMLVEAHSAHPTDQNAFLTLLLNMSNEKAQS